MPLRATEDRARSAITSQGLCPHWPRESQGYQGQSPWLVSCYASDASRAGIILGAVDAKPLLVELARCIHAVKLDAVLIGNAPAALHGAPVTTIDFDFLFRKTPRNLAKLKELASALGALALRPYYPASDLYRIVRDDDGLQVDFMATIHGVRSFEGLRDRATSIEIDRRDRCAVEGGGSVTDEHRFEPHRLNTLGDFHQKRLRVHAA